MRTIGDNPTILDQGEADAYARWFYDAFNPMTHIQRYGRSVAISFQCGLADTHVPADGALEFAQELPEQVTVDLYEGVSHMDGGRDERLSNAALNWLTAG